MRRAWVGEARRERELPERVDEGVLPQRVGAQEGGVLVAAEEGVERPIQDAALGALALRALEEAAEELEADATIPKKRHAAVEVEILRGEGETRRGEVRRGEARRGEARCDET